MNAQELFRAGELRAATEAATRDVKSQPTDTRARSLLFELLCFAGEYDRADKQLDVIAQQDAESEWAAQVYHNLIAGERERRLVFEGKKAPGFLLDAPEFVRLRVDALERLSANRPAEAARLIAESDEARPERAGAVNGTTVDEFVDCDDLLAPVLEFMVLRDYIWLPFSQIRQFEVAPPERPRDLLWAPIRLTLADGTTRSGYCPGRYFGAERETDDRLRLGRLTDWREVDGPTRGVGARVFLAGDQVIGLFELSQVSFSDG